MKIRIAFTVHLTDAQIDKAYDLACALGYSYGNASKREAVRRYFVTEAKAPAVMLDERHQKLTVN